MEVAEQVVPLIYTIEGNVPVDSLRYAHEWEITDENIFFKEFWYNQEGTLVRNSVHVYARNGVTMTGEQFAG